MFCPHPYDLLFWSKMSSFLSKCICDYNYRCKNKLRGNFSRHASIFKEVIFVHCEIYIMSFEILTVYTLLVRPLIQLAIVSTKIRQLIKYISPSLPPHPLQTDKLTRLWKVKPTDRTNTLDTILHSAQERICFICKDFFRKCMFISECWKRQLNQKMSKTGLLKNRIRHLDQN